MHVCMQVVEALEIMVLAILSAAVKCEWDLSSVQEAAITTVTNKSLFYLYICKNTQAVFFGFLIGNPVWGTMADKFGRKKVNFI